MDQSYSFVGFKVGELIKGNAEAVKIVVSALFALWVPANPALQLVSGAALKLVLDLLHYYTSK